MNVVISQPMFLPWVGLFEQMRLADVFVHYDDVQIPQGRSFISRVQLKGPTGTSWLTAPIDKRRSGRLINQCYYVDDGKWRVAHLNVLSDYYRNTPGYVDMFRLVEEIYGYQDNNIANFNKHGLGVIADYLGLSPKFVSSSELGIEGVSTERLVSICKSLGASRYITGLGALRYIDYSQFDAIGISLEYMSYQVKKYDQKHGSFTPYVSVLDAIACCGSEAVNLLVSESIYWKDFVNE